MADFPKATIDVRYATYNYGPFNFDLEDALPSDVTIQDVTVRSFLGNVKEDDDLSGETETTSELVDSVLTVKNGNCTVDVYLNYPTTEAYIGENHTLIFEITTSAASNTAKQAFYYYRVKVHG